MKAAVLREFKAPLSIEDVAQPYPGAHEVLIVPHLAGTSFYGVRAVDHVGNIGPLPL